MASRGVTYVKDGGEWGAMNFGDVRSIHIKDGGSWTEITQDAVSKKMHIKDSGVWSKVYPTTREQWTNHKLPTYAEQGSYRSTDFDPSYPYTGATSTDEVRWNYGPQTSAENGRTLTIKDFNWNPSTVQGFEYGAITRVKMTITGMHIAPDRREVKIRAGISTGGGLLMTLPSSFTVFTLDQVAGAGGWNLTYQKAGSLHVGALVDKNNLYAWPEIESGFLLEIQDMAIKDFKCSIKYKY